MKSLLYLLALVLVSQALAVSFPEVQNVSDPLFPYAGDNFNGYIQVNNATGSNIYYHLFGYNNGSINNSQVPLLFWLQGGPGCGSEIAMYCELGPYSVIANASSPTNYSLIPRNTSWTKLGHVVFVDQPIGSGFSAAQGGEAINTTAQAAVQFQVFIARFFQVFPQFLQNDVYLLGESYAGHWIPAFANYLLTNTSNSYIKLKGVGLGDAWVNPLYQTPVYSTFCYVVGLLNQKERDYIKLLEMQSVQAMLAGDYVYGSLLSNYILDYVCEAGGGCDEDNYRNYPPPGEDPVSIAQDFLNEAFVQQKLKLPIPYNFSMCSDAVGNNMLADNSESVADKLPLVLNKLKTLIYVGQDDENVNYEGILAYFKRVRWEGVQDLLNQNKSMWTLNGDIVGYFKETGNVTFVTVLKSGHLVPGDQPEPAFDMMNRFINDLPFN